MSLKDVAVAAGVDRNTVGRWVKQKLLPSRTAKVRNLEAVMVRLADVKKLAEARKPGRPKGSAASNRKPGAKGKP